MTTEEQANADALWPHGTDASGLGAMCQGLLYHTLTAMAVYIGTANVRGILMSVSEDMGFWGQLSRVVPVMREQLREQDAIGKAMDDAERASKKEGAS